MPETDSYGNQYLDVSLLIDKHPFDKLSINESWEGYFMFNDYPTGKVLRQNFTVYKLEATKTVIKVSVYLSKEISVVDEIEPSFLLKDDIIHELNSDGFPQ